MNKLRQLLQDNSKTTSDPSDIEMKIPDELQELTKKFDEISLSNFADELFELLKQFDEILRENISDYQVMKIKITDVIKKFCSMNNVKTVCIMPMIILNVHTFINSNFRQEVSILM